MASENRVTLGKAAQFRRHEPGRRLGTLPRGGYSIQGIAKGAMAEDLPKPPTAKQAHARKQARARFEAERAKAELWFRPRLRASGTKFCWATSASVLRVCRRAYQRWP